MKTFNEANPIGEYVIVGLLRCIKGYFYGLYLRLFGVRRHQRHIRLVETFAYNEFHNRHVLVLDSIYPEIGVGVYQGEVVIMRQGVMMSLFQPRWVIYTLDNHRPRQERMGTDILQLACSLVTRILLEKHFEYYSIDSEKKRESLSDSFPHGSRLGEHQLFPPVTYGDIEISPRKDVVYQVIEHCPRLQYYFSELIKSTKNEPNCENNRPPFVKGD
jgi:hypothetical protein